jgi:hypothetical protein
MAMLLWASLTPTFGAGEKSASPSAISAETTRFRNRGNTVYHKGGGDRPRLRLPNYELNSCELDRCSRPDHLCCPITSKSRPLKISVVWLKKPPGV